MRNWVFVILMIAGCSADRGERPFRSPTRDYPLPSATTSDGEVMGADRTSPADKLATGASVGTEGSRPMVRPAARPPGVETEAEQRQRTQQKLCQDSEVLGADNRCKPREMK